MSTKKKVVVVTGCSAGIGRATALLFGKKGHAVALISRNQPRLESLRQEIGSAGGQPLICVCDVSQADQVEKAAQNIENLLGPIDIWINNAMTSVFAPLYEISAEEFKRVTEVTYLGNVNGTLAALKRMRGRDSGLILQVGSALAYRGIPLQAPYCGAKHAIKGYTESLRCELLHENSGVKVTMVEMPALNTPQFNWVRSRLPRKPQPVPPIYQPEVAARAIYWAATHYRREWIVGMSAKIAISVSKVFPALADFYLGKTGYESQQYNGPEDPKRPDNLFESVEGEYGAHGDFDDRAKGWSFQFWCSKYRVALWLGFAAAVLALIIGLRIGLTGD